MSIADLERELAEQRRKVERKKDARHRWRTRANRKDAKLDRLVETAEEARDERDRNRSQLVVIRDRIEAVELDGVSEEERERHARLITRLEGEVDANEELTALIQRIIARAVDMEADRDKARARFRNLTQDVRAAIARREKIAEQLRDARDAARNPLASPYFVVAEFDCRGTGTPVPPAAYEALRHNVKTYLEPLRKSGGIVHINSGYRTRSYNAQVGGASNSIHVYDEHPNATAADHWQEGRSPGEVQRWHDANTNPDAMGYYSSFTHVDNRGRIGWGRSRWNGP